MIDTGYLAFVFFFGGHYQDQTLSCSRRAVSRRSLHTSKETKTDKRIPRPGAQTDAVVADAQAAHTVVVAAQRADLVAAKNIPYLMQLA